MFFAVGESDVGDDVATVTVTINEQVVPPQVANVVVNDGNAQRSNIEKIAVMFSKDMNI